VKPATVLMGFVLVIFLVVVSKAEGASIPPGPTTATATTRASDAAEPPAPPPDAAPASNPLSADGRFADTAAIVASLLAIALAALAVFAVSRRR
jgi:hypothetical protein